MPRFGTARHVLVTPPSRSFTLLRSCLLHCSSSQQVESHTTPCAFAPARRIAVQLCRPATSRATPLTGRLDEKGSLQRPAKARLVQASTEHRLIGLLQFGQRKLPWQQGEGARRLLQGNRTNPQARPTHRSTR